MSSIASSNAPAEHGLKRPFTADQEVQDSPSSQTGPIPLNVISAITTFRNVSACNRCRVRKGRCDQQLDACEGCKKAGTRCVGYDPISKREIPRSYVYFLESRLHYFESLLNKHDIAFEPSDVFNPDPRVIFEEKNSSPPDSILEEEHTSPKRRLTVSKSQKQDAVSDQKLEYLVSNIKAVSVTGTSDHRYLGSTSGISFARVVLAAVKKSVPNGSAKPGKKSNALAAAAVSSSSSIRDTYFSLQTKPRIREAPFPDYELGKKLVDLYFEHANPQIPILHRVEYMQMFDEVYAKLDERKSSRELYLLNIVFAIGAAVIWGSSDAVPSANDKANKRAKITNKQAQPEEYHASAIVHLGALLSSEHERKDLNAGSDLEELQAVLLLASFALLRPVAPGLWYIVGVAMRLAVDLGLHYEDGSSIENSPTDNATDETLGRRMWIRDIRRRLWWCTYAFDRLVCTCVGRPCGITDQVITTEFPSLLDDVHITKSGFTGTSDTSNVSYKRVAHHYLELRLLQSEMIQVLQYEQAQSAKLRHDYNRFMHDKLCSPFLVRHKSFRAWRKDIDQRLYIWKTTAPTQDVTGVAFPIDFLELNYWQAVIMLYRQSLSVPTQFADEINPTEGIKSPTVARQEDKEDEDMVYLKCAEAGERTLKLYRQLHRLRLVNYTYLATHHIFMAAISFLYAVWHSPLVRGKLTLDDFDFTVLAATSVLGDLKTKCPPAEACRDALERMSKATVQMCMSQEEFNFGQPLSTPVDTETDLSTSQDRSKKGGSPENSKRPMPKFDMDLGDLFPEGRNPFSRTISGRQRSRSHRKDRQPYVQSTRDPSAATHISPMPRQPSQPRHAPYTSDSASRIFDQFNIQPADTNVMDWSNVSYLRTKHDPDDLSTNPAFVGTSLDTYNPDFMSNIPGMPFFNGQKTMIPDQMYPVDKQAAPMARNAISPSPAQSDSRHAYVPDMMNGALDENWLGLGLTASNETTEADPGSGFGVGIGMGLDFGPQHDWSDGQAASYNFFDNFFFGAEQDSQNTS